MTPSLAEIKAAAEAETPESYGRVSAHRAWLVERCEELAEALIEIENLPHGERPVREQVCAICLATNRVLARLEEK